MKIDKKIMVYSAVSVLILVASSYANKYVGPIVCTIWIIFMIIRYGMKGGMAFALLMSIITSWHLYIGVNLDPTLSIVGIFTYFSISLGIGLPIDLIRREQASRLESEERLRRITDNIQDVIIQIDKNGVIQYISPSCLKNLGYSSEFYMGKNFYNEIHTDDYQAVAQIIEEALLSKDFKLMEYRYRHKDGHYVWLESLGDVVYDNKNSKVEIVINCRDITDRRKTEDKIKYLSFHDTLTGLYNRTYFDDELDNFLEKKVLPLSIIIGDVNGLKLTNDVFGHYEGDRLLIKVSSILRESCRREDIIVRWGGDEFAILLPGIDENGALATVNRISENCRIYSNEPIKISIALGNCTKNTEQKDIRDIIKEAEEKMYRHKLLESKSVRNSIITSLEKTLFERSYETKDHADRMMEMAQRIGTEIGLSENEQDELKLLALLHDIGKIAIRDDILGKPDRLTEEEWEEMKKHPEIGYRIAESTQELYHISNYILSHHERWDGTGYPHGLKGYEIPKLSRIISIIDAYDVMTHTRTYKAALSPKDAIDEINKFAGTQFDPVIAAVFIGLVEKS
jgi:diguanylate cyclase (GGDEF)-like protein/PAS domain S-box-containing protein